MFTNKANIYSGFRECDEWTIPVEYTDIRVIISNLYNDFWLFHILLGLISRCL